MISLMACTFVQIKAIEREELTILKQGIAEFLAAIPYGINEEEYHIWLDEFREEFDNHYRELAPYMELKDQRAVLNLLDRSIATIGRRHALPAEQNRISRNLFTNS